MGEDLDTLKTVIRSLLVASKKDVPLQAFLRDYRDNEGRNIPFQQFGYKSVQEFLESLKDTVRVTTHGPNMVFLSPAITKDIQHIDKLVRTQKSTPSKRGAPRFPARRPTRLTARPLVARRPRSIVDAFHMKRSQGSTVNRGYPYQAFSNEPSMCNSVSSRPENGDGNANWLAGTTTEHSDKQGGDTSNSSQYSTQTVEEELEYFEGESDVTDKTLTLNPWDMEAEATLKESTAEPWAELGKNSLFSSVTERGNVPSCRFPDMSSQQDPAEVGDTCVSQQENVDSVQGSTSEFSKPYWSNKPVPEMLRTASESHSSHTTSSTLSRIGEKKDDAGCTSTRPSNVSLPSEFPWMSSAATTSVRPPTLRVPQYGYSQGATAVFNQSFVYHSASVQPVPCGIYTPALPLPRSHFAPQQVPYLGMNPALPMVGPPLVLPSTSMTRSLNGQLNATAPPYVPRFFSHPLQGNVENQNANRPGAGYQNDEQSNKTVEEGMPADVAENVTELLKHRPEGLNVKLLPKMYEDEFGQHHYFSGHNKTPKELVYDIIGHVHMVSVSTNAGGEFTIKLVEPVQTVKEHRNPEKDSSGLPTEVASGIEKMLRNHPEGILVQELPELYKAEYGPHAYFSEYTRNPTRLTLAVVSGNPQITATTLSNRKCLLKLSVTSPVNVQREEEICSSFSSVETDTTEEELSTYCRQTLPTTQEFSVVLGEVYSPAAFFILVKGKDTSDALTKLMDDMNAFYNQTPPPVLTREDVKAKVPCAATYAVDGQPLWHRAQVLSRTVNMVNILYVDFGTCDQVAREQLRYMVPKFMELPTQGIRVKLAGVKPRGSSTWSDDAKAHFLNMMRDSDLKCKVEEWNGDDFEVKLWKVNSEERSIADMLVYGGYAEETHPKEPVRIPEWEIRPHYLREGAQLDIITWKGVQYVTGRNVSELFHWGPSAIEDKLAEKQIIFNVSVVSRPDHPAFVVDITREQCASTPDESVTLFKLQSLPDLLNLFNHPSRGIRKEVEDILCDEVYLSDASTDEDDRDTMQQKLKHKLTMLQEERKALRMKVYAGDPGHEDELSFLEKKIDSTNKILEQVKVQCQMHSRNASSAVEERDTNNANGAIAAPVRGLQTKLMELLIQSKS